MLALDRPASGTIRILGEDITAIGEHALLDLRKRIGVAFQSGAMLNSLTVADNLKLPLREHAALAESQMDIMARMKIAFVNLEASVANKMPSELSGGMLKRAALARAIMMDPPLLFCDEPSAGLDPAVSASIDDLILRLRDALDMTIVVVTHERESAFKIADRFTILDRGEVLMVGTLDELRGSSNRRIHDLLNGVAEEQELGAWI
jgi:phospholipid/cholesterol/gamma-HCH transport system ATP-binding protein